MGNQICIFPKLSISFNVLIPSPYFFYIFNNGCYSVIQLDCKFILFPYYFFCICSSCNFLLFDSANSDGMGLLCKYVCTEYVYSAKRKVTLSLACEHKSSPAQEEQWGLTESGNFLTLWCSWVWFTCKYCIWVTDVCKWAGGGGAQRPGRVIKAGFAKMSVILLVAVRHVEIEIAPVDLFSQHGKNFLVFSLNPNVKS